MKEDLGSWQKFRRSCGNVAFALMLAGFGVLSFSLVEIPCSVNHAVTDVAALVAILSAVLAVVGKRYWVLVGAVLLFLIVPMFACA